MSGTWQFPGASLHIRCVLKAVSSLDAQLNHVTSCNEIFLAEFPYQTKGKMSVEVYLLEIVLWKYSMSSLLQW